MVRFIAFNISFLFIVKALGYIPEQYHFQVLAFLIFSCTTFLYCFLDHALAVILNKIINSKYNKD